MPHIMRLAEFAVPSARDVLPGGNRPPARLHPVPPER